MVMVGSSDFALEVCFQLHEAGVRVKGIIEKNSKLKAKKQKNLEQVSALHIPVYLQSEIETAAGKHTVEKVFLHTRDKELEIKVDLVCTEGGFIPAIEPFQMADSSVTYVEALGGWVPAYDKHFRTSEENIYIAGDAAGITCHGALILTGALAGIHVMEDIGHELDLAQRKKELWRELERIESGFDHCVWDARVQHMAGATIN
jgi:sarcosine oxidase subunit alpha